MTCIYLISHSLYPPTVRVLKYILVRLCICGTFGPTVSCRDRAEESRTERSAVAQGTRQRVIVAWVHINVKQAHTHTHSTICVCSLYGVEIALALDFAAQLTPPLNNLQLALSCCRSCLLLLLLLLYLVCISKSTLLLGAQFHISAL